MRIPTPSRRLARAALLACGLLLAGLPALADAPAGYYDAVDASTPASLRTSLHQLIDDHTRIPYTASVTDTWNVLELADEDPNDPSRILDVYLNASYQKWGAGNNDYNREHTWPKSYGFPNDGSSNYPYTDCHQLFLCDDSRNSSRSNKPYGDVGAGGTEYTTVVNDGVGGGSGVYPGWSNWANATYWETWTDRRGDVARAMFYMDVRYEGGTHGGSGAAEPDLILTDNLTLIQNSNTGSNEQVAYMGILSVLVQWHLQDPPDAKEMHRNDMVYAYQGNRNPFIDNPDWVACLFEDACSGGDTTPPAIPLSLVGVGGDGVAQLDWNDNGEADLAGYHVYRAATATGTYVRQTTGLLAASQWDDTAVINGTTYWYAVSATDLAGNESALSTEVAVTPNATSGPTVLWINEIHYDNASTDTGEFFEVAGTAGTDLTGWRVVGYNGNGGLQYNSVAMSGLIPDQQDGYGTRAFAFAGMQNGAPDGLALVDPSDTVVEFISYEGSFTAADGPAGGLQSTDIGVAESSSTPVGYSLQLVGTGSVRADFSWAPEQVDTPDAVNTGQTFVGASPVPLPAALSLVSLDAAYPNPFNPATTIRWSLREPGQVRIAIYSVAGQRVATLLDADHPAGEFSLRWNGTDDAGRLVPSGAYFCRIVGGGGSDTRPLLLLK